MKTGFLLRQTDIDGGIVFPLKEEPIHEESTHYEEDFNEIKEHLFSKEVANRLVNEFYLADDLFDGDQTFQLIEARWDYGVILIFRNDEGEDRVLRLNFDRISIFEPESNR